jgi:hypothetical protein
MALGSRRGIVLAVSFHLILVCESLNVSVIEDLYNVIKSQPEYENLSEYKL